MRDTIPAAWANFIRGPMKPSGMAMQHMNAGSASSPVDMSQIPTGSEARSVQGTTDLIAAIHTQLCLNQSSVES